MRPILSIATTTVGEAIRRRVLLVILFIGVLFLAVAPGLGVLSARSETTVLRGMMLGVIQLTSAVIAIVQGALGTLIFWLLGIEAAILWGVVMAIMSLLPAVGPALVWVPAAVYLLATGALLLGGAGWRRRRSSGDR